MIEVAVPHAVARKSTSPARDLLQRIRSRDFQNADEKRALYDELAGAKGVRAADVLPFLFSADAQLRVAAGRCLALNGDAGCVRSFLEVAEGRTATARRTALAALLTLPALEVPRRLEALLGSDDQELRSRAIRAVLDLPLTRVTAPVVAHVAETGNTDERSRAALRFASSPSDRHRGLYRRLLDDPEACVRQTGYGALVAIADDADLELLLSRLGQESGETQEVIVEGLERLSVRPEELGLERIMNLLASGNDAIRRTGVRLLLRTADRPLMLLKYSSYSRHLAGWLRERAFASLLEVSESLVDAALSLMDEADPHHRTLGFALVAGVDDPRVVDAAGRLLEDGDVWVAIAVVERLAAEGAPRYTGVLIDALGCEDLRWAATHGLGRIGGPVALQALAELTQDPRPEIRIEAMSALALSDDDRVVALLEQCVRAETSKFVRARAADLYRAAARRQGVEIAEAELRAGSHLAVFESTSRVHRLLAEARRQGASDLHLAVERTPAMRVGGELVSMGGEAMSAARADDLLSGLLTNEQRARLTVERQIDACFFVPNDGRYRGSLFRDRRGLNAVFRVIPEVPPSLSDIGAPAEMVECATRGGLVIFAGRGGVGKTTTLAAVVNHLNDTRRAHIVTLEDPVEFVHTAKMALVNQRDLGRHGVCLADAVRAALQQDVEVLMVGETRNVETLRLLLTASEAGVLVLTTMSGTSALSALEHALAWFPARDRGEGRALLAANLSLVVAQQLVPGKPAGRVACFEWLRGGPTLASRITAGEGLDAVALAGEIHTFDQSLAHLIENGRIDANTAFRRPMSRGCNDRPVKSQVREEVRA